MDNLVTDYDILNELLRPSEPDSIDFHEDNSDSVNENDIVEEDDVLSDVFSPDGTEDEYFPSEEEEEDYQQPRKKKKHGSKDCSSVEPNPSTSGQNSLEELEEEENNDDNEAAVLPNYVIQLKKVQLVGKNKHRWSTKPPSRTGRTPRRNIILFRSRPEGAAKGITDPLQVFDLFIDNTIIHTIVVQTNKEIAVQKLKYNDQSCTGETSVIEIRALLGLIIYFGAQKQNHTSGETLWHVSRGLRITRTVMPLRRFEFLVNSLRFDEKTTRAARKELDPFAAIRDVWDAFIQHCKELYTPGPYCTIDEQLLAFRGKCPFRMYIPNKPAKYGVKIVMLCNSNGYLINAIPYTGKKMDNEGKPQAIYFVEKLSETIQGTNRNITVDNWFTSVPLFNDMLKNHNITMVGTLRKNKPHIPPEMIKNRPAESSLFLFDRELTMVSYAPKRNKTVLLLSNMHQGFSFQKDSKLPEIIHFYNSTKGGVDLLDQMSAQYSCSRKTRRWPLCIFYGILNSANLNSYIIYRDNMHLSKQTPMSRNNFLFMLAEDLMRPWMIERLENRSIRIGIRTSIAEQLRIPMPVPPEPMNRKAGRCNICPRSKDTKTTIYCADCRQFTCKTHSSVVCDNCKN